MFHNIHHDDDQSITMTIMTWHNKMEWMCIQIIYVRYMVFVSTCHIGLQKSDFWYHHLIWSPGDMMTWWYDHMIVCSYDHMIMWWYDHKDMMVMYGKGVCEWSTWLVVAVYSIPSIDSPSSSSSPCLLNNFHRLSSSVSSSPSSSSSSCLSEYLVSNNKACILQWCSTFHFLPGDNCWQLLTIWFAADLFPAPSQLDLWCEHLNKVVLA